MIKRNSAHSYNKIQAPKCSLKFFIFDVEATYWHTEECLRNGMYIIQIK